MRPRLRGIGLLLVLVLLAAPFTFSPGKDRGVARPTDVYYF